MSKIGKNPIKIPTGVTITQDKHVITVTGPKGVLSQDIKPEIIAEINGSEVVMKIGEQTKESTAFWGLYRALIANMVTGVTTGFERKLELVGVGYRVKKSANGISVSVGYSHPVEVDAPKGIEFEVVDEKTLVVKGIDKQLVGHVASLIRAIRKPEPYKGKGIKYAEEVVRRKAGKTGKA